MDCFKLLGCHLENYLNGIDWHPGHSRNYYLFAILLRDKIHPFLPPSTCLLTFQQPGHHIGNEQP